MPRAGRRSRRYECPSGTGDPNNYAAAVYLYAADLTLEQAAGPSVTSVAGELANSSTVTGTADVAFGATDPGSGVYEAVVQVDGGVVQSTVLDEEGGRCRDVGGTTDGRPAFLYLQPCPSSASGDLALDTTRLSDGPHHLIVSVIDAAGNAATVLDRTITVANAGPAGAPGSLAPGTPNGVGASALAILSAGWRGSRHSTLTVPYGRRETIVGRLTGIADAPIAGARIDAWSTNTEPGAAAVAMRPLRTDADGRFSLVLPRGLSSRTLRLAYYATAGEPAPAASANLQLAVRAPVAMSIAPRTAAVGTTIRFRGSLGAGPVPRGGVPVILEARSGRGAWIEFHVARTDSRGRFRASYRFRFPGPASYVFRAVCEQESAFPFATGYSPGVTVRER